MEAGSPGVRPERRLAMTTGPTVPPWRRALVLLLTAGGVALIALSFAKEWWRLWMYAPQYPKGLHLTISLTGVGGDVREINTINHYIGMQSLEGAAVFERAYAVDGVAVVSVAVLVAVLFAGKRLGWLTAVPAFCFPLGFVADSFYWLYKFGHELDRTAPLQIPAFTPELFGNGEIGQFKTFAQPGPGFWIALAGAGVVLVATILRQRSVCAQCSQRGTCGAVCKTGFVREASPGVK